MLAVVLGPRVSLVSSSRLASISTCRVFAGPVCLSNSSTDIMSLCRVSRLALGLGMFSTVEASAEPYLRSWVLGLLASPWIVQGHAAGLSSFSSRAFGPLTTRRHRYRHKHAVSLVHFPRKQFSKSQYSGISTFI